MTLQPLFDLGQLLGRNAEDDRVGSTWNPLRGALAGRMGDLGAEKPDREVGADQDVMNEGVGLAVKGSW